MKTSKSDTIGATYTKQGRKSLLTEMLTMKTSSHLRIYQSFIVNIERKKWRISTSLVDITSDEGRDKNEYPHRINAVSAGGKSVILGKGHEINKTNTYLERRIEVIYYSKQVASVVFATYSLNGLQLNVISLLEEFIICRK